MEVDTGKLRKNIFRGMAVAFVVAAFSLLVLRAVYAFTLFNGLSGVMQNSGWKSATQDSIMQDGESLTFEASYLFFKIGSVKMEVLGKTLYHGVPAYHVRALINSYSGIPFVNLHAMYNTYQDAKTFMCLSTDNIQKDGKDSMFTSYNFEFNKKILDWTLWKNGVRIDSSKVPLDRHYTDGVSFFYYIREASRKANGARTTMSVPIVVDTVRSTVDLTINEKKEDCKVTAFKYPLEAYKMSGHINFTGFFGVTGDFTGWMSADSAEVPLKADVSVILGSVVVKLKDASRPGWIPPKSND
jgi:hypothetical protein